MEKREEDICRVSEKAMKFPESKGAREEHKLGEKWKTKVEKMVMKMRRKLREAFKLVKNKMSKGMSEQRKIK